MATESARGIGGLRSRATRASYWPRWANVVLGVWLFVSAFAWPHSGVELANTWVMGVVVTGFALIAIANPDVRWVNTIAGAWLFVAAFALPHASSGTVWNDALVGAAVAFFSLMPTFRIDRAIRA